MFAAFAPVLAHAELVRTFMAAAATLFGVILGTFAGLGTYRLVHGPTESCGEPLISHGFQGSLCDPASNRPYLLVGILLSVALCHLWMWRMLRD
jgi:hypothetical protein